MDKHSAQKKKIYNHGLILQPAGYVPDKNFQTKNNANNAKKNKKVTH